jgi:hypothetical protein
MADTVVEELRAWAAEIARNKEGHATWKGTGVIDRRVELSSGYGGSVVPQNAQAPRAACPGRLLKPPVGLRRAHNRYWEPRRCVGHPCG